MFKITTQEELDKINEDYFTYFPQERGVIWSGCNYYINTGTVWNEPVGTAQSKHYCDSCPEFDNCEDKKNNPVWLYEEGRFKMNKKMYCLNEDGVAEWIVAESPDQAIEYYETLVGKDFVKDEYYSEVKDEMTYEEFLEGYIKEEFVEKEFTLEQEDGTKITKTIKEFLEEVKEVPSYFACSEY